MSKAIARPVGGQAVYGQHTDSDGSDSDGSAGDGARTCRGQDCFRATHGYVILICCCAALALAGLTCKSRGLYLRIWRHEARDRAALAAGAGDGGGGGGDPTAGGGIEASRRFDAKARQVHTVVQ